ncbi:hypothetical protein JCM17961_50470 [Endothiovibrio diazotrophicus]
MGARRFISAALSIEKKGNEKDLTLFFAPARRNGDPRYRWKTASSETEAVFPGQLQKDIFYPYLDHGLVQQTVQIVVRFAALSEHDLTLFVMESR